MLARLIEISLRNRLFVLAAAILLLVYGGFALRALPVDVFPDLDRPLVSILTEAPGLAPEEVETLVTRPLEIAVNGVPGVQRIRSSSGIGLSILSVELDWGSDLYRARQLVQERIQLAADLLPEGVTPVMGPIASIMGEILLIGISSRDGTTPPMELRSIADWTIRPRLLTLPGVAQVIPIGGGVRQYQINAIPERMAAYGVTLAEVVTAAASAQQNSPGGFLETAQREALVRNVARTSSLEEIASTVVAERDGTAILLRDVADVAFGRQIMRGDASVSAAPAVIVSIQKQPGVDTVHLTQDVTSALAQIRSGLPEDVEVQTLFEQARFIEASITNVEEALRDGAVMVTIVLFLFLLSFRTTLITLAAIPLSFVVTAIVFRLTGLSINTMTLGGLAVAIGMVVDDAIVDVENVFRRLRENLHAPSPRPPLRVIADASNEVRSSILFATLLVILVFIPLFGLAGIEGRLFAPIGIATIVSMAASFVVSITVIPALCSYLLPSTRRMGTETDGCLVRRLKALDHRFVLGPSLRHPWLVSCATLLLVAGSFALYPLMGKELLPDFNEGTATINVLVAPGTSLAESNRIGSIVERLLLAVPEVASTGRRTGRAELDEHAEGVHYSEIDVDFRPSARSREAILHEIRERLSEIPGIAVNVGQPISHRLDHLLSGVRAQVAVKLFGPDLAVLRGKAAEMETRLARVRGVVDLQTEKQVLIPQVVIQIRRDRARLYGARPGAVTEQLETALNGHVVGQVLDGERTYDVFVRYGPAARESVDSIRSALLDVSDGRKLPVSLLADVRESLGPNVIQRENTRRRIVVSANVSGRDLTSTVADMQAAVAEVSLPAGYSVTFEGQFQSQQEATRTIAILGVLTLATMFLVLYSHFRSGRIVAQILLNIPLAFAGGLTLTYLLVGRISIASLVGLITLAGIASRNTIMMISHYLHLMRHEGERFSEHMIVRGSLERLVPVTMTALTAGLALIPLVFAAGEPGKEILYPVATVILGGLVSSTVLDMAVTPTVFFHFGRPAAERSIASEAVDALDVALHDGTAGRGPAEAESPRRPA